MPFRIMLLHIGERGHANAQTIIRQMKSIGSSTAVGDNGADDVCIPNSELLVHISDATGNTAPDQKPVILTKSGCGAGAILIYDTTRRESFVNCAGWIYAFRGYACSEAVILLVADRSHENSARNGVVSHEDGKAFAENIGTLYHEVDTRKPHSSQEALYHLSMEIYRKVNKGLLGTGPNQGVKPVRRHSTSCASPTIPTKSDNCFLRRDETSRTKFYRGDSIPEVGALEAQLSCAESEVERMREQCETERAKQVSLQQREQQLLRENSVLIENLAAVKRELETAQREKAQIQTEGLSLARDLEERENSVWRLKDEISTLQHRLQDQCDHLSLLQQEKQELNIALRSKAQENADSRWRLQQQLNLKEQALENEVRAHGETQLALDRAREQLRQSQRPRVAGNCWRVERQEVVIREAAILGRGAWGYVAEGEFRGKTVAVKCLHEEIVAGQTLGRVQREICTMARVRHPNIVLFIAAVLDEQGTPLIISELLDTNLRAAYEGRLLNSTVKKIKILRGVACALNYLHKQREPIIHRDISAPNVLLLATGNTEWTPKVTDFGSANLACHSRTLGEGAIIYSAPETFPQSLHGGLPQTTKIDVYSFGVLAGEVLTEELPNPDTLSCTLRSVAVQWPQIHTMMVLCTKHSPLDRPDIGTVITAYIDPALACS